MATLFPGQTLQHGQSLQSDNQWFTLTMQSDGNVVLYNRLSKPLWQTNTAGTNAWEFIMQTDGNLVLYGGDGNRLGPRHAYWASKTQGNPGAFLNVQDDGNLVVYRAGSTTQTANNALWDAGVPPPLNLQTVVASGATLNVGDADLSKITQGLITSVQAADGGVIIPSSDPHTEQGAWSYQTALCLGWHTVTVNASITATWTSLQLQDAFAGALWAVMQHVANKTAYENYSEMEFSKGCGPQKFVDWGHHIPPEILITARDNSGAQIAQVTATYSTEDQSGGDVCGTISDLVDGLLPLVLDDPVAAVVGTTMTVICDLIDG